MIVDYHNVRLPGYITIFAIGSAQFSTSIAISMSGKELRQSDTLMPLRRYLLKGCILSIKQFEEFYSFFNARLGRKFSFRIKDHFDYIAQQQIIGIGDGKTKNFQLSKTYKDCIAPYERIITHPYLDSIKLWTDYDALIPEEINPNTGIVTLHNALLKGQKLYADFEFDVPVRFGSDEFKYSLHQNNTIILSELELVEVSQ